MSKTALVTGATGFIGSYLTAALVDEGWQVHVIVRPSSSLERLEGCRDHLGIHVDDGTTEGLADAVAGLGADVCYHLASHFVGRHGPADVQPLVEANVSFPTRLAEAVARSDSPPVFVNTGTIWQQVEGEPYRPAALYAATKQACQDMLKFYADEGLLRVITLALYDNYGPNDTRRKLLNLLRDAQRDQKQLAMSPGEQLIDLNYIDDVVRAFLRAPDVVEEEATSFARYGVSSEAPVSLRELVRVIEEVTGRPIPVQWGATPYRPREMMSYWKGQSRLPGWEPKISLDEGIRRTWSA